MNMMQGARTSGMALDTPDAALPALPALPLPLALALADPRLRICPPSAVLSVLQLLPRRPPSAQQSAAVTAPVLMCAPVSTLVSKALR